MGLYHSRTWALITDLSPFLHSFSCTWALISFHKISFLAGSLLKLEVSKRRMQWVIYWTRPPLVLHFHDYWGTNIADTGYGHTSHYLELCVACLLECHAIVWPNSVYDWPQSQTRPRAVYRCFMFPISIKFLHLLQWNCSVDPSRSSLCVALSAEDLHTCYAHSPCISIIKPAAHGIVLLPVRILFWLHNLFLIATVILHAKSVVLMVSWWLSFQALHIFSGYGLSMMYGWHIVGKRHKGG